MADALLSIEDLTKYHGDKLLFQNITFGIAVGQKTALVARNGYGKSTLLNIIAGLDIPDAGKVTLRNRCRVAYLPQTLPPAGNFSVKDFVFHNIRRPEHIETWDYEQRIDEVLSRLDIRDMDRSFATLSGGEQKKAGMARLLIDDADLLLLDEPTNHLDINMVEWLERFLFKQRKSILLVTHDRYFLDHVCQDIVEIDQHQLYHYEGNYSYFLQKKAEREHNDRAEIERAKSMYRSELKWMQRMPQARGTKARARVDAFYELEAKAHTRIVQEQGELNIKTERIGGKVLEVYNISKSYEGRTLLHDFSYTFKKGEKIGIVGPNGIGKSTLLEILTNTSKPDSGHVVVGQTIRFGYYKQHDALAANSDMRVLDIIKEVAEVIELSDGKKLTAHQFLTHFGFTDSTQYNYYGNLSGGERRRLYLLTILMANPNFLILDEPTNDLDLHTLELLERFLIEYTGCLIIVSHDRSFMDNIVDHLFVFEGNGVVRDYPGNYSQYRAAAEAAKKVEMPVATKEKPKTERRSLPTKPKASYKEKCEYESLTQEIDSLNAEKQQIEEQLSQGTQGIDAITKLSVRLGDINQLLDEKELRWLELDDLIHPTS